MPTRTINYTLLDSFTTEAFKGNSTSIIVLDEPIPDETKQLIAREFNLAETAFVTPLPDKPFNETLKFGLRWFTPTIEIALCGHATLGAAKVLFSDGNLMPSSIKNIHFETLSGTLTATKIENDKVELSFPAGYTNPIVGLERDTSQTILSQALGDNASNITDIQEGLGPTFSNWLLVRVSNTIDLKTLSVRTDAFTKLSGKTIVIITREGTGQADFISRVFAPLAGIPEDPVTGSAHCLLGPYWTKQLGTQPGKSLFARQVSEREGAIEVIWNQEKHICLLRGDVRIMGRGQLYI